MSNGGGKYASPAGQRPPPERHPDIYDDEILESVCKNSPPYLSQSSRGQAKFGLVEPLYLALLSQSQDLIVSLSHPSIFPCLRIYIYIYLFLCFILGSFSHDVDSFDPRTIVPILERLVEVLNLLS